MSTFAGPQLVSDPHDPRIEPYRAIRERDLVGRRNLFIAEGELVVRALLGSSAFTAESILLAEGRAGLLHSVLAERAPGIPVYLASRAVLDEVAGFPMHRGVLAVGRRGPERTVAELLASLPADAVVLGLVGIANHDNVGGLFRNAAAFGVDAVLLDASSCDPLYRKAIRVSVGAVLNVPFSRGGTGLELAELFDRLGFDVVALSPGGAEPLSRHRWRPRTALLVGAEGLGLPRSVLDRARSVRIPMTPGSDSLNVATAAAIALHAAREDRGGA